MHQFSVQNRICRSALCVLIGLTLAACGGDHDDPAAEVEAIEAPTTAMNCLESGEFSGRLVGSLEGQLDWQGSELSCTGMRRPNGEGVRLRFSGPIDLAGGPRELAVIIALPELEPAEPLAETPARITIIEEDSGRFFSSGIAEVCWSNVERQDLLRDASYDIRGIVYCVSPLAELRGTGAVTFTELFFAGQVDWSTPE